MKFAKKMVMVPETEYYALRSVLQDGDYLHNEKVMLDAKIRQNLDDPTISEDIKAKRNDWLYKERRTLKDLVENRPQKVTIVNQGPLPTVAPYMGITNHSKAETTEEPRKIIIPRKRLRREEVDENISFIPDESGTLETPTSAQSSQIFETPEQLKARSIIHPSLSNELFNYVSKNKDQFKITALGKIQTNTNLPIEKSNYKDALKYLLGSTEETPRGTKFLKDRLLKDEKIKQMVNKSSTMWGEGKGRKVVVRVKSIKTPGILRETKPFKPTLWAKL